MLKELINLGTEVIAWKTCINARGLTHEELIEEIKFGSTVLDLAKWVKDSQKVLSF